MAIQPVQPQSIGGVLDTTFQLFRVSIGRVWPLCLLSGVGSILPSIYMLMKGGANPNDPFAAFGMFSSPGYWLTYLVSVSLSLWALGSLYLKIRAIGLDEEMSLGEALQASASRVPLLFLMSILFGIAVMIGMILLIVPGLILAISLILSFNLLLFEGLGPVAALTGSHKLVWGNWWRTFAVLSVGFVIIFVIYLALGLLLGIVIPFMGVASDPIMFGLVSGIVIGTLASVVMTPFYVSMAIALYWDLKLRREGGDLAARVGALGTV